MEMRTELPEEIVGWVGDAARRFDVTRSVIVQRALEHYLRHMDEIRVEFDQRQKDRDHDVDWDQAKQTLKKANCQFDNCPFSENCPAEVCRL